MVGITPSFSRTANASTPTTTAARFPGNPAAGSSVSPNPGKTKLETGAGDCGLSFLGILAAGAACCCGVVVGSFMLGAKAVKGAIDMAKNAIPKGNSAPDEVE